MKKNVLIFGINGQDGSNLSDYLLTQDCNVFGMVRRHSYSETQQIRLEHIKDKITVDYGDVTDSYSVRKLIELSKPDYIFNLAAMSHVAVSFALPQFTQQVNFIGHANILEAYRDLCPKAKLYFAGSSEIFGLSIDDDDYQRETTTKTPTSPYGISKLAAINLTEHYRRAYKLHATVGILFNHSGIRRGINFAEQKTCKAVAEIKQGKLDKLQMGNLDTYRDFGNSIDYVRAMWKIINHKTPDTFVISTGIATSIRDICKIAFNHVGLNYEDFVVQKKKYIRDEELPYLRGDCTKAKDCLGWVPEYTVEDMICEMVDFWMDK